MRIATIAVLVALLLGPLAAHSAQDDPRLEALFAELAAADARTAVTIADDIWAIWHEIDDPASARLLRQGSDAMANNLFAIAIAIFDRLIDRSPEFAEAWNKRATVHFLMGNDQASIADIERTLALEPRHFGALSGLGMILARNDRPAAALRSFEAAVAIHPHLPGGLAHIAALRQMLEGEPS